MTIDSPTTPSPARRLLGIGLAACLLCASAVAAGAATVKVDYRLTLAGLTIGTADYTGRFDGDRYDTRMTVTLSGLASLMSGGATGGAQATGTFSGVRAVSTGFSATGKSGANSRTVRMGVAGGSVSGVSIEPPFEERPDRVPLGEADTRNIIDPMSGLLAVTAERGRAEDSSVCNRTIPVFDGTQRFNIVLTYGETKPFERPGFKGNVVVCNARYRPISGHRLGRPSVKFMEDNREMSVWLAAVPGTRVLVPVRISVLTMMGTTVVEAERWKVE